MSRKLTCIAVMVSVCILTASAGDVEIDSNSIKITKLTAAAKKAIAAVKDKDKKTVNLAREASQKTLNDVCKMTWITELWINYCEIDDLRAVSGLKNLQRFVVLGNDYRHELKGMDLTPLAACKRLENLQIWNTKTVNVDALKALPKLSILDLKECSVDSLDFVKQVKSLTWLRIAGHRNTFKDYEPLRNHQGLEHVNFTGNRQANDESLELLPTLPNLTSVFLCETAVEDPAFLSKMKNLDEVNVYSTKVKDLSWAKELPKLRRLIASDTQVTDLTPLATCTKLRTITLGGTKVTDVTPLLSCKKLRGVDLPKSLADDQRKLLEKALPKARIRLR